MGFNPTYDRGLSARISDARKRTAMASAPPVVRQEPEGAPAPQMPSIRSAVRRQKVGAEYGEPMQPSIAPPPERAPDAPPAPKRPPYRNDLAEWMTKHPWQAGFMNMARPGSVHRTFQEQEYGKRADDEQRQQDEDRQQNREDRTQARKDRQIAQGRELAQGTGDPEMLSPDDPNRTALAGAINRSKRPPVIETIPGMRAEKVTRGGVTYGPDEAPFVPPKGMALSSVTKGGQTWKVPEQDKPDKEKPMTRAVLQGAIQQRRDAELKMQAEIDAIDQTIKSAAEDPSIDVERAKRRKAQIEDAYQATVSEREAFETEFAGSNTSDGGLSKEEFEALEPNEQREYLKANKRPR